MDTPVGAPRTTPTAPVCSSQAEPRRPAGPVKDLEPLRGLVPADDQRLDERGAASGVVLPIDVVLEPQVVSPDPHHIASPRGRTVKLRPQRYPRAAGPALTGSRIPLRAGSASAPGRHLRVEPCLWRRRRVASRPGRG